MPRSFRLLPPEPTPRLLARPRLLRTLIGRWDHRVTVLTGGAGLGKTTVLTQAVAENRLAPRGEELWIGLDPHDTDLGELGRSVARTMAMAGQALAAAAPAMALATAATAGPQAAAVTMTAAARPVGDSPRTIAEALWQRAPTEMCLVFDDVHHLAPGSDGAVWLAQLIDELPANSHVVLAGRGDPAIPLARLEAQGAVLRLGEDVLRFSSDELASFAAQRGVEPAHLEDTGGWPALAELTANVDRRLSGVYLWEEVLEPLGEWRRHVLAVLADLGGADQALADAALGQPADLAQALEAVPLVARTADGWWVPHALWRHAPRLMLDDETRAEVRRRAAEHLTGRGRFDDAFDLVAEARLWDLAPPVLRAACLATDRLTAAQLERWLTSSPPDVHESGPGYLARGMLAAFTNPPAAAGPLQVAIERCHAADDIDGEMAALARLARNAWFRQEDELLGQLVDRVTKLEAATGHPAARGLATVARAAIFDLVGDDAAMLEQLESIPASALDRAWELLVSFWTAQVRLGLGETEPVHRIVQRLVPGDELALRGAGRAIQLSALSAEGRVDEVVAGLPGMLDTMRAAGVHHNVYLALNGASIATARVGDVATAQRWFDESLTVAPSTPGGGLSMRSLMAQAYLHQAAGDEAEAAATLRHAAEVHGVNEGIDRDTWRQHVSLSYVLLPETRDYWDGVDLRGHLATARRLAAAVVAVREGRSSSVLPALELPALGVVRSALEVRLAAELAAGLHAAGRSAEAGALLEALGPPGRVALRDLAAKRAKPAKALLASVPAAPPRITYVAALGSLSVRHETPSHALASETLVDADLKRTKPQALLGFLVLHRRTTRSAATAALWPDLDERAAANNLGVTLNHLLRALEPWRHSGEPPYLLRLDGSSVRLVTGEHLRIDLDEFESHVAAAVQAEADGVPSLTLEHDLAAVDLYRDDLFADLPDAEWLVLDREHYRIRFVNAAVRAGQLLLGRREPDAAETVAHRALAVDRWAEEAYAVLIGAAMARRDRSGAHRMLGHCIDALDELGAQPSAATCQLRRRVLGIAV